MYGLLEITEFEESHSKIAVRVPLPNLVSNLFGDSKISVAVVYGFAQSPRLVKTIARLAYVRPSFSLSPMSLQTLRDDS